MFWRKTIAASFEDLLRLERRKRVLDYCEQYLIELSALEANVGFGVFTDTQLLDEDTNEANKDEIFRQRKRNLESYKSDQLFHEIRINQYATTISAIDNTPLSDEIYFGHLFTSQIARAINNLDQVSNPDQGVIENHASSNYLMKTQQFPFGDLIDQDALKKDILHYRKSIQVIIARYLT